MEQIDIHLAPKLFIPLENTENTTSAFQVDILSQKSSDSSNLVSGDLHKTMLTSKFVTRKLDKIIKLASKDIHNNEIVLNTLQINEKKLIENIEDVNNDTVALQLLHQETLKKIVEYKNRYKHMRSSLQGKNTPTTRRNSSMLKGSSSTLSSTRTKSNHNVDLNLKKQTSSSGYIAMSPTNVSYMPISAISVVTRSDLASNFSDDQEGKFKSKMPNSPQSPVIGKPNSIPSQKDRAQGNSKGRKSAPLVQASSNQSLRCTQKASMLESSKGSPTSSQTNRVIDLLDTYPPSSQSYPNNLLTYKGANFSYTEPKLIHDKRKGRPNEAKLPTAKPDSNILEDICTFASSDPNKASLLHESPQNIQH
ncbi:hypothetical protein MXB_5158 [Myxobolus squamalis]|nr:hypothetical protein MXB_5158 [Myxobolus squamalis]